MRQIISRRSLLLLVLDLIAMTVALQLSGYWRNYDSLKEIAGLSPSLFCVYFSYPFFFYVFDLYYPFKYFRPGKTLVDISIACIVSAIFLSAAWFLNRSLALPRPFFLIFNLFIIPGLLIVRSLYDVFFQSRMTDKKTLIIGTGDLALNIAEIIQKTPHSGMELLGFVSEEKNKSKEGLPLKVLGDITQLVSLVDWHHIELAILAVDVKGKISEPELVFALLQQKVQVTSAIHLFERMDEAIPYDCVNEHFILGLMSEVRGLRYLHIKRILDFLTAGALLLVFSPVMLFAYIFLFFQGPKDVFFMQDRVGVGGKKFRLIKFRTMTHTDSSGRQRVTWVGKWLRKFRIDETPQLINVLKGDMSVIGPRPEIDYFVERCRKTIPYYDAVFSVRPGITGWAQVKFLHTTEMKDYPRKFCFNLYYLKNISLQLDLLIILKTIRIVLIGGGK